MTSRPSGRRLTFPLGTAATGGTAAAVQASSSAPAAIVIEAGREEVSMFDLEPGDFTFVGRVGKENGAFHPKVKLELVGCTRYKMVSALARSSVTARVVAHHTNHIIYNNIYITKCDVKATPLCETMLTYIATQMYTHVRLCGRILSTQRLFWGPHHRVFRCQLP